MRNTRVALWCAALVLLSVSVHAADPVDADVLTVREAAWRAWFGGDEAALRSMLPEEFLAIGAGGAEINGLDKTIASSRAFKEEEKKLRGKLTEIFVKRDGRWLHPGWHLDLR